MNLAVIAANGRSGRAFVNEALEQGHHIRAGVHNHNNLIPHPNLEIVNCDASNIEDLNNLIAGQDAVVSLIGHVKNSQPDVQTKSIDVLIRVMHKNNLRRVVSLTGTGVRFDGDNISLTDKIMNATIKKIDPNRINDGIEYVQRLKASDIDWTVIRVLKLTNKKPKAFQLTEHGPGKLFVSRTEVAKAVLETLQNSRYIKQAPIISRAYSNQLSS